MATRNKTAAFLQHRNSIRQSRPKTPRSPEHVALNMAPHMPGLRRGGGYIQLTKLEGGMGDSPPLGPSQPGRSPPEIPPQWVEVSEKVKEDMAQIKTKIGELAKAQSQALLPSFGPTPEKGKKTEHEERMEVLTSEITRALKSCERRLQRLSTDSGSESTSTICRNIQRCMATDLQSLSMEFRKLSKQYLKRLQEQQQPQSKSQFPSSSSTAGGSGPQAEDDDWNLESFPSSSSTAGTSGPQAEDDDWNLESGMLDQQQLVRRGESAVDQEREQEMQQISQSVQDLAQIMKDLSVLVIDQGTIVDRIDYNIQNVSERVNKGVEQLEKAEKSQKRTAMVACIMCLMVACLVLFVLLILKKLLYLI